MRRIGTGEHSSPAGSDGRRRNSRRRRLRASVCALALTTTALGVVAASASASGFAEGPPAGPTSPPFTQCPAIGQDSTCEYLIRVKSTKAPPKIVPDKTQTFYDGGDDVTVAVQNETSEPLGSIHIGVAGSFDNVFGLDSDGLCSESIFPKPEECPFGPNLSSPFDYYGPDTGFTIESADAGTVFFNIALQPGQYTYFSLEAPPNGTTIVAGEVNDTMSTTLTAPENPEVFPEATITLPAPANVTDAATIKGPNAGTAGGTVEYGVYEDPECTKLVKKAGTVAVESGVAKPSEAVGKTLATNQTYYWRAVYSGDGKNSPLESCGIELMTFGTPIPPPQPSIVTVLSGGGQVGASITVPEGTAVTDTAIITAPGGQPVSGRLTYAVYNNSGCTGKPIAGVGGGGATTGAGPSTKAVTLGLGTYYFQAFYSGNGVLHRAATACGAEVLTVVAKPPPPPPPPSSAFNSVGNPQVNEKNGQIIVIGQFPATGTATARAVVHQGATLARLRGGLAEAAKTKKCKHGFVKKHNKCVNNAPVLYGTSKLAVLTPGTFAIVIKPNARVLKALKAGKRLNVTVSTTFQNSKGGAPVTHVKSVFVKIKKPKHKK
jgi:hypothetical protein